MRRRELIVAIGGATLFGPFAPAGAQQSKRQLIATLSQGSERIWELLLQRFRQVLAALGWRQVHPRQARQRRQIQPGSCVWPSSPRLPQERRRRWDDVDLMADKFGG
jgi:hypothetical protein